MRFGGRQRYRSLSVILRCPANGRASTDERPPICRGIDPGRRPSRLASLAPQGDGEGDRSGFSPVCDLFRKPVPTSLNAYPYSGVTRGLDPTRFTHFVEPIHA